MKIDLSEIKSFLACPTPQQWIETALLQQDIMLIDHAHCEKKAASTALSMMYRYVDRAELLHKMSRIAREELRHFEKVLALLQARHINYCHLSAARYAEGLRQHIRPQEPDKLIDTLIIGAFIEARSCERFASICPYLDDELKAFYESLLKSEARHYQDYLGLAQQYSQEPITDRVAHFAHVEKTLILQPDPDFRFHSGVPIH